MSEHDIAKRQIRQFASAQPKKASAAKVARAPSASPSERANRSAEKRPLQELQRQFGNHFVGQVLRRSIDGASATTVQKQDDIHHQNISGTTDTGNKYTQELDLNKTSRHVQIQFGIHWVKQGTWANDAAAEAFKRRVKTAVYGYLDNKFKIVCTPSGAGATPIELRIDFLLFDSDSGYKIEIFGGQNGGSEMTQAGGKLFELGNTGETALPAVTAAHEFGHCLLGASDEYANAAVPGRTLTNDHSIMANYYTQGIAAAEFKVRHFQHILTAVAAQYPGHTCRLAPV